MPELTPTHCWQLPGPAGPGVSAIAAELSLHRVVAELLVRRGFATTEAARGFLEAPASGLRKPDSLPDIRTATDRLVAAVQARERVLVSGDYDVDGITGTALLVSVLTRLGCPVDYYLPRRTVEGYGFPVAAVEQARSQGSHLIVTNDTGSSDPTTVAAARAAGIDVIVTDHHELAPDAARPEALAFVNPKRPDSGYPFRELAGAGVAFKLAWSLLAALGRPRDELTAVIDLAGLGTLCDIVPLVDENRVLARLSLRVTSSSPRPGIKALLARAGIRARQLSSYHAGFIIGPRINAAGRVGHAARAVRLLLTEDEAEADAIAAELDTLNRSRQSLEETTLKQALAAIEHEHLAAGRTIVVTGDNWHDGVIGIVASRLAERFWRPAVVLSFRGDHARGSVRSVPGFDLYSALRGCSEHLATFGGHRCAAGLSLERRHLRGFRAAFERHAAACPAGVFEPNLHVEALVQLDSIDDALLLGLERLEPFGPDNPVPLMASLGVEAVGYPRRVGQNHLAFQVRAGTQAIEAIAWRRSADLQFIAPGPDRRIDICYSIDRRSRADTRGPRLSISDLRAARPEV